MAKTTPKRRVKKAWPTSYAYQWAGPHGWVIYNGGLINLTMGQGATAAHAWREALAWVRKHGTAPKDFQRR